MLQAAAAVNSRAYPALTTWPLRTHAADLPSSRTSQHLRSFFLRPETQVVRPTKPLALLQLSPAFRSKSSLGAFAAGTPRAPRPLTYCPTGTTYSSNSTRHRKLRNMTTCASVPSTATSTSEFVLSEVLPNGVACLRVDKPKALNASDRDMVRAMLGLIRHWKNDSSVKCVLVDSTAARAFCSGGDVKALANAKSENPASILNREALGAEYELVCEVFNYPKPYISLCEGVTMGFGVGLSAHGHFRLVTENTLFAMPENVIGLFPDVGFAKIASQSAFPLAGLACALSGARFGRKGVDGVADIFTVGLGTHYVPADELATLREKLCSADFDGTSIQTVQTYLDKSTQKLEFSDTASLIQLKPTIEHCLGVHTLEEAIERLERTSVNTLGDELSAAWAHNTLEGIRKGSPFTLEVTWQHFNAVRENQPSIEEVMRTEFRIAVRCTDRPDFCEGVRAALIDKDGAPKWQPNDLTAVSKEEVTALFGPFEDESKEF